MPIFWFVIWGTRRILTKLGYVADFCPICRQNRPFSVFRVGKAAHLYFISFGNGNLVGHLAECQTCHSDLSVNPNLYQTISKNSSAELKSLIQETFPSITQHYQERLEVEEDIRRNPRLLSAETRANLIEEPFLIFSPAVEAQLSSDMHFDREGGFACLFTIVVLILLTSFLSSIPDELVGWGFLIVFSGFIYTIVQLFLANQRYLQRKVVPLLVRCLKPLNPSLDELQTCLDKLATQKLRLGRRLKAQQLITAIENLRNVGS
jgi:hypothetical protein